MPGQVTQSVRCWHKLGGTQKDKAERKPGFPSPPLTSGETEARTGARVIQDVKIRTSSSQNRQATQKKEEGCIQQIQSVEGDMEV